MIHVGCFGPLSISSLSWRGWRRRKGQSSKQSAPRKTALEASGELLSYALLCMRSHNSTERRQLEALFPWVTYLNPFIEINQTRILQFQVILWVILILQWITEPKSSLEDSKFVSGIKSESGLGDFLQLLRIKIKEIRKYL